jgi:hypothetical protein
MAEKLFVVYLKGSEDPTDRTYQQTVSASTVEVTDGCLVFAHSDGELSAFFDLSTVRNWHEVDEAESSSFGPAN